MKKSMSKSENKLFYEKLMSLVLPIAFQNFMLAAVGASDAIMLGMLEQNAMSAVSLAGQIQFVHSLFLTALVIGATMLVAQYWGKGDKVAVEKVFAGTIRISALLSLLFSVAAIFAPRLLMTIFTKEEVLITAGATYLRYVGISYLLLGFSQIYICVMKNCGEVRKSTIVSSSSVVINIILNAVLIFGLFGLPRLEIRGAAIATVISKVLELLFVVIGFGKKEGISLKLKYLLRIDPVLEKDFWKYTTPVLGNELAWGCGYTMYSVIMGHLGTDAVAANSLANIAKNLIVCFCLGVGTGSGILVGNELGRGDLEKARLYGDKLTAISIISGVISGAVLLALSPAIVHFANISGTAKGYLQGMLIICSYYLIGKSINSTVIPGIFCAGGDSKFGLICDTITMWAIAVPIGLLAAFVFKLPVMVVYAIVNIDEIIKLPAVFKHYKKYNWVRNLTRKTCTEEE